MKLIHSRFKSGASYKAMNNAASAIKKYYVLVVSCLSMGHYPLISRVKKSFWQQRTPFLRYCGNLDVIRVLRFIEGLVE